MPVSLAQWPIIGLALSLYLFLQERAAHERAVAAEKEQARLRHEAEQHAAVSQKIGQAGLLMKQQSSHTPRRNSIAHLVDGALFRAVRGDAFS